MSDDNKQELSPRGTLKIETDDETFEVSFEDLNRYPDSLLASCIANSIEGAEETIQYERDAEYLSIILDYMRDESHKVVEEILSKTPEELLAICKEAQYFLLDDLVAKCRKTLLDHGMSVVVLPMITTKAQLGSIYRSAEREQRGLILINAMADGFQIWMPHIHGAIRLVDSSLYAVYKTTLEGCYEPVLSFKRPELSELKRVETPNEARCYKAIYKLNSTGRNTAAYLNQCRDLTIPT